MTTIKNKYLVKDLVIEDDYDTITSKSMVKEAALMMKEKGIPDLVVLQDDGSILGIIADYDIVIGLVASGKSGDSTKVTETMYRIEPVTLETPVQIAFNRMQELDVSAIPVCNANNKIIGVVTIADCWGYLPEKYEDYKGLLTVSDARFANYWFTLLMTIFYFFFGILAPIMGMSGFLRSNLFVSSTFNPSVTYYLFDARGGEYFIRYLDFKGDSIPWMLISFYSLIFVLVGILSAVLIIQWAYSDYHMIKKGSKNWENIAFIVALANIFIMWISFIFILSLGIVRGGETSIDYTGLFFSVLAIIFLTLAISRDFFFKQVNNQSPLEGND